MPVASDANDRWAVGQAPDLPDPRPSVSRTLGLVLIIFGALAIGVVLVGGVLMARLLTMAADRSDVWKRHGWLDDEGGEHPRRKDS